MLTGKRRKALEALLTNSTRRAAAHAAGIDEKTLRGYLEDEDFLREYRHAFTAMIEETTRAAQIALSPAITTLRDICEDTEAPAMARISAARCILDVGMKMTELNDIEMRLEALENANRASH